MKPQEPAPQIRDNGIELLRVLCGSRAYGLADDDSDFDYHGVFAVPTSRILSIGQKIKETSWIEGESEDNTAWEVRHFLELALSCNPTVLETFVAPVVINTRWGADIRQLFHHVLSRRKVYDSFQGYAHNQRKKMFDPAGGVLAGERMWKFAVTYLRSLYHGTQLLRYGSYDLMLPDSIRSDLRRVKIGEVRKGEVINAAEGLLEELTDAYLHSKIPEEPSVGPINDFLLALRKELW